MGENELPVVPLDHNSPGEDATKGLFEATEHRKLTSFKMKDDSTNDHIKDGEEEEEEKPICRICHCSSDDLESGSQAETKEKFNHHRQSNSDLSKLDLDDPFFLITPCFCTGTLQFVHHKCLQHWIRSSNHKYCELCKYNFKLKIKNKPLYQWECLNMTCSERRKLIFQLIFNFISIIFVFWSIYVIAERAAHQMVGQLDWRFWLKMLIVTIGFLCGILFIFFQLKLYVSTIVRWKQFNQIVIIENVKRDQPMTLSTSIDLTCCESK